MSSSFSETTTAAETLAPTVLYSMDTEYFPDNIQFNDLVSAAPYHSDDEPCIREFLTMLYGCDYELLESPELPDELDLYALPHILLAPRIEYEPEELTSYTFEMRIDPDAAILYQLNPYGYSEIARVYRMTGFDKTLLEKLYEIKESGQ